NANNLPDSLIEFQYKAGVLNGYHQYNYRYDSSGNEIEMVCISVPGATTTMDTLTHRVKRYADGKLSEMEYLIYLPSMSRPSMLINYLYDTLGNMIEEVQKGWNSTNN